MCIRDSIVDMMGGDNAPLAVLEGAAQAVKEYGVQLILSLIHISALHAFLEHADFARLAAAKAAGTLDAAIPAERDRQVALQLTAPEIAEKLDAVCIHRFVESEAFVKICAAEQVLRELPFITALPAGAVLAAQMCIRDRPQPRPKCADCRYAYR